VPMAVSDPSTSGNPIPLGADEMRRMFVAAIEGNLEEN